MDTKNANSDTINLIKQYEDVSTMLTYSEKDDEESDNFFLELPIPYLSYSIKITKEEARNILMNKKKQLEQQLKQL